MSLVRYEREKRGLSQSEVARRAHIPGPTLNKIEQGTRRLAVTEIAPLAKAIGCDYRALIPGLRDDEPLDVLP